MTSDRTPEYLAGLVRELCKLPPGFTRTVLFAHKPLAAMSSADRIRACYLHACLRYVTREDMTNTAYAAGSEWRSTTARRCRG